MVVGILQATVYLHTPMSLKDKRSIIKSTLAKIRNQFNAAAAEVDLLDDHHQAVLGFSIVSNETAHANKLLSFLENYLESNPELELTNITSEVFHA